MKTLLSLRLFTLLMLLSLGTATTACSQSVPALDKEAQAEISPAEALDLLKAGNARFLSDKMLDRDFNAQVSQTATGQYPFAVVLGCIDSRVSPELVFDQGIGDIFSARVAGNFVNTDILGSMEFATKVAGSKLIVVLGHSECGAVKGACDHVALGNLTQTLSNIAPAVYAVDAEIGERNSKNPAFVDAVAHMNVRMTVDNILERSSIIQEMVNNGELLVVGAMHDISTGKVTFLE